MIRLGVLGRLREKDRMLFGRDTKLVVESVMLDLLLVVPVHYDTVLNRVLEGQDTTFRLVTMTCSQGIPGDFTQAG